MSINLPAFELFEIDAVGFQLLDFMAEQEAYQQMVQQLQQAGKSDRAILLHNADGYAIDCNVVVTVAPHYSGWLIVRFSRNQRPLCHLHSNR